MKHKALLIGINRYGHAAINPLRYAEQDARSLARILEATCAFETEILLGSEATRQNILAAIQSKRHPHTMQREDLFLLFFAGHGQRIGENYVLFPADAHPGRVHTTISMAELSTWLEESIPCEHCLCILDACRGGGDAQGGRGGLLVLDEAAAREIHAVACEKPGKVIEVLFGCREGQCSWEDSRLDAGHGVLTWHLLEVLKTISPTSRLYFNDWADLAGDRMSAWRHPDFPSESQQAYLYRASRRRYARLLPADEIENPLGMKFRLLPEGEFIMGCDPWEPGCRAGESSRHKVRLSEFYLGVFPVTVAQMEAFMKEYSGDLMRESLPPLSQPKDISVNTPYGWSSSLDISLPQYREFYQTQRDFPDRPVVEISWEEIQFFCRWLSEKYGGIFDLPTEAQWEYACRAGAETPYYFGSSLDHKLANFGHEKGNPNKMGKYAPNAWGLYDMHGNVSEWCRDAYGLDFYEQPESRGLNPLNRQIIKVKNLSPEERARLVSAFLKVEVKSEVGEMFFYSMCSNLFDNSRVTRGGCYCSPAQDCRSGSRQPLNAKSRHPGIGFRLVWKPE